LFFSAVTSFSIPQNTLVELFLINHQGSPFQGKRKLGSTNGVSTDFDGKFQLPNAKKGVKSYFLYWLQNLVINYDGQNQ
jgi:iron complex outermembrane receptor protein